MLEIKLLGQFEVLRDGQRVNIPSRNAQTLFAYIVLNAGKAQRRERLAGLLWPDSSDENARSNLRHELWRLRKAIPVEGESFFLIDDLTIAFNPNSSYSLDVNKLETESIQGGIVDNLIVALSAYQGELLPGFYDEWVFAERERLNRLFEAKITRLLEHLQNHDRWDEVIDWGTRWIGIGGWPEPAYRALISAYATRGDVSKAMAAYERYAQVLQKEMGIKPSSQTQALYKRLRMGWKSDINPESSAQERLKPLLPIDIPAPPVSLPRVRRSNLPRPLTSFIGRAKEIQDVEHTLSRSRLVTITGPGGVGKTRLAIQTAGLMLPQFKDGVWWVELATISLSIPPRNGSAIRQVKQGEFSGSDLVIQAIATVLRVPESPGVSLFEEVIENLQEKQLLLVLDNCEHLVEACATLAERILSHCTGVTILATSREPLGVPGEKAWSLPSLSLPEGGLISDSKSIFQSEAVSLLVERAADVLPGYQPNLSEATTLAQICRHLDGIPLAIELAAARMNLLSACEIAARLDRRFNLLTDGSRTALLRHQTLLAAIEWSYDLLNEAEQVLFRCLSVFVGSFTLEAIESTCTSNEIQRDEVLSLIGRLVDKSLVTVQINSQRSDSPTRYYLLESIRSFSRLRLDEAGKTRWIHNRHADYYACLAETAEPELLSRNQVYWFELLQAESDNLRATIEWCAENDQPESALRLVGAMMWFWFSNGSSREGRDLALKALNTPSAIQIKEYRAKALNTAGLMQCFQGDIASARQLLEEALSILKVSDDESSLAWTLEFLGLAYAFDGEYELADAAFQEGLAITRTLGATHDNNFLHFLGDVEMQKGDRLKAQRTYEESVCMLRSIGSKSFLAYPLRRLGHLALEQSEFFIARKYFQESLELNLEVGDKRGIIACLISMAALAICLDKSIAAAQLFGLAKNMLDSHLLYLHYIDQAELDRLQTELLAKFDVENFTVAFTQGWEMGIEQAIELISVF